MEQEKEHIYPSADYFRDGLPVDVFRLVHRPENFYPPELVNRRQFWKILYVISGEGILRINHRKYPIRPGFACLNHPDDLTTLELEADIEIYNLLFQLKAIEGDLPRLYSDNRFFSIFRPGFQPEQSLNHDLLHLVDSNRRIGAQIRRMHYEYHHADANSGEMMHLMLLELLIEFSRRSSVIFNRKRRLDAVDFIEKHLASHFSEKPDLNRIAGEIGISKGYLFTFYRKATGRTIGETLLQFRIAEAVKLLESSDMSVEQICFRCGFSDLSNFYKAFKRETGAAPGSCRRKTEI